MTTSSFLPSIQHSFPPLTSVFPHLLTLMLCTSVCFSGLLLFFRKGKRTSSLSETGISQPALDFWRSPTEVTAPEGVPGGPGTAELLPQPRGSPAGGGEHSHPHPAQGWPLFWGSSCNHFAPARFASSERPGLGPGAGPEQPEHSRGGHGHSAPGAAAGAFSACFFWLLVSLKSFFVAL